MKVLVSSVIGEPRDARTWSNAPTHLITELEQLGVVVDTIDNSQHVGRLTKLGQAGLSVLSGRNWHEYARSGPLRRRRQEAAASAFRKSAADLLLCTSSIDAPVGREIPYALWIDDTWHLLNANPHAPRCSDSSLLEVDRLERAAYQGAKCILAFSEHVAADAISHYGVQAQRVHVVGCGSGSIPALEADKTYANGHLLFVAKHIFDLKGGAVTLAAFEKVRAARPQTRLVVVGTDETARRLAGRDGVDARGFVEREELNNLFHGAAMLVQPMLIDPWGQVYLEAMKAKALVVSWNNAAIPELTDNGRLGGIVATATPDLIAAKVLELYNRQNDDLTAIAREAQRRVLDRFAWPAVGRRVHDAILGTL